MLTEEKPEEFASPEQNHENGSKKKKKKKKNNETLPQSNEHSQPQVSSEPLVVTPISEFKSNQEESNEPKPSLDATVSAELENKKEVEKIEVCAEFGETGSGKIKKRKRKSKSEKGKIGDVVVVENALNHDKEQVNSIIDRSKRQKCVQDGAQSNEHNVESAETAVQISVVDREVSPVDSIIGLNNQLNGENEHNVGPAETVVQMSVIDSEVSRVNFEPLVVTPISEFKSNEEAYAEFAKTETGEIKKKKKKKKSVINGEESNEHNVGPSETVVQMSVIDSEVSRVNSEPSVVTPISQFKSNEEAYAKFAKTQTGENKKKKKKKKKSVINGEESNEHNVGPAETTVHISVVDREVSPVDSTIRLTNQLNSENEHNVGPAETVVQMSVVDSEVSRVNSKPSVVTPISEFNSNAEAYAEFAKTQTGEIKKKKKKKKSVINGEESNEPKPSLDAAVSTEFENKKEVEKSEVYAEFAKTQTGEKTKRKSKSETGKMGEVVVTENVLNHDSEQVNEIDRRKRQKSVQDGAQSNEHNVEPAETTVQISVVDREVSPVDPTIRLNNQPANLVEQKDERRLSKEKYLELLKMRKIAKEEERKIRQEKHLELLKMQKIAKEERKIAQEEERKIRQEKHLELMKMHKIAKEERKIVKEEEKKIRQEKQLELIEMQKKANEERNDGNKNKTQVESKDELKSTGEEKTNSGICLACREPNHSIKQCQKLKSLSKDEEICFFCGEIGHSLGKCSVYIAGEIKKKKRKKKSVINGEESNESKPSLDATVSTEFENKKEVEKSEVYAEFPKTQTGEKRKRKSESETGKMGEVVLVENVLNHDSEQVNEIDSRKRQKSVHDGAQSNEHNVEPAETVVQISVVDREVSPVDPTIRLNNQPANLVEQKDERKISQEKELLKMHRKELRKIRQEKHLELRKMSKIAKEKRKIKRLELVKMQMKAKEELKSTGEEKINSGICWACREPNHSIKQCRKLKSLSKDEEICFFCGEIGHSLGKCSVYIAGGGRLARCLFCNLHGHFSYNCPGHGYFQGAVAGGS